MTAHAVYAKPPQGDPAAGIKPPDTTHLGYVLRAGGIGIYISGDPIHTFADHAELTGPVAALKPDIGLVTCHPSEGEFPFFDGAALMAQRTGLAHVVPSHYACFVTRDYDPHAWAASMPPERPRPIVIPRNSHIVYPG